MAQKDKNSDMEVVSFYQKIDERVFKLWTRRRKQENQNCQEASSKSVAHDQHQNGNNDAGTSDDAAGDVSGEWFEDIGDEEGTDTSLGELEKYILTLQNKIMREEHTPEAIITEDSDDSSLSFPGFSSVQESTAAETAKPTFKKTSGDSKPLVADGETDTTFVHKAKVTGESPSPTSVTSSLCNSEQVIFRKFDLKTNKSKNWQPEQGVIESDAKIGSLNTNVEEDLSQVPASSPESITVDRNTSKTCEAILMQSLLSEKKNPVVVLNNLNIRAQSYRVSTKPPPESVGPTLKIQVDKPLAPITVLPAEGIKTKFSSNLKLQSATSSAGSLSPSAFHRNVHNSSGLPSLLSETNHNTPGSSAESIPRTSTVRHSFISSIRTCPRTSVVSTSQTTSGNSVTTNPQAASILSALTPTTRTFTVSKIIPSSRISTVTSTISNPITFSPTSRTAGPQSSSVTSLSSKPQTPSTNPLANLPTIVVRPTGLHAIGRNSTFVLPTVKVNPSSTRIVTPIVLTDVVDKRTDNATMIEGVSASCVKSRLLSLLTEKHESVLNQTNQVSQNPENYTQAASKNDKMLVCPRSDKVVHPAAVADLKNNCNNYPTSKDSDIPFVTEEEIVDAPTDSTVVFPDKRLLSSCNSSSNSESDLLEARKNIALQYEREVQQRKPLHHTVREVVLPERRVTLTDASCQTSLFSMVEPGRMVEMVVKKPGEKDYELAPSSAVTSKTQNSTLPYGPTSGSRRSADTNQPATSSRRRRHLKPFAAMDQDGVNQRRSSGSQNKNGSKNAVVAGPDSDVLVGFPASTADRSGSRMDFEVEPCGRSGETTLKRQRLQTPLGEFADQVQQLSPVASPVQSENTQPRPPPLSSSARTINETVNMKERVLNMLLNANCSTQQRPETERVVTPPLKRRREGLTPMAVKSTTSILSGPPPSIKDRLLPNVDDDVLSDSDVIPELRLLMKRGFGSNPDGPMLSQGADLPELSTTMVNKVYQEWRTCVQPDDQGNIPLHNAVLAGDVILVKRQCVLLKARKQTVDMKNLLRQTPLHLAILNNDAACVRQLLMFGARPSLPDKRGNTAVHMAVEHGSPEVLGTILTESRQLLPLNVFNDDGFTPLHLCSMSGKLEHTRLLLNKGADVNIKDARSGRTALFHAVETADCRLVLELLNAGAVTTAPNYAGQTPLVAANEMAISDRRVLPEGTNRKLVSRAGEMDVNANTSTEEDSLQ